MMRPMTAERRRQGRVPLEMWVEEAHDDAVYFQRAGNLSAGGLFLERTIPHPVGTVVELRFTLPGDAEAIRVRGEIVNSPTTDESFGMGLKFINLGGDVAARIERFVAEHGAE